MEAFLKKSFEETMKLVYCEMFRLLCYEKYEEGMSLNSDQILKIGIDTKLLINGNVNHEK